MAAATLFITPPAFILPRPRPNTAQCRLSVSLLKDQVTLRFGTRTRLEPCLAHATSMC